MRRRRLNQTWVREQIAKGHAVLLLGHHCDEGCGCDDCATTLEVSLEPTACCGRPTGLDTPYQVTDVGPVHVECIAIALSNLAGGGTGVRDLIGAPTSRVDREVAA